MNDQQDLDTRVFRMTHTLSQSQTLETTGSSILGYHDRNLDTVIGL
jgi:hypothetical protein